MIDVIVDPGLEGAQLPDADAVRRAVRAALEAAGIESRVEPTVCIRFASDEVVRELNHRFRRRNRVTDVLSFPMQTPPVDPCAPLGDVALAAPFTLREARRLRLPAPAHALHLIVHAVLHLLGHVHETDADAVSMQRLENRAMDALGLHRPYPGVAPE